MCDPNGNSAFNAPTRAALPALALRNDLRLIRSPAEFFLVAFLLISNRPSGHEWFGKNDFAPAAHPEREAHPRTTKFCKDPEMALLCC
jgi:hypothetical protein